MMGFSKAGLITQLTSGDHFSQADATFAVENIDRSGQVNWNEQAVRKAKDYMNMMAFSKDGLVTQLKSGDHFTPAQAQYGASAAYGG
jgi:DNA relaxase NicK